MSEDDEQARRERAQELRAEIEALASGRAPRRRPTNPRDFVDQKAAEERERARRAAEEAETGGEDERGGDAG